MKNNTNVELEENNSTPQSLESIDGESNQGDAINETVADGAHKKKYHSSAMYAGSKWHSTVSYVKPTHAGLNL